MDFEKDYADALEALELEQQLLSFKNNSDLICECKPTSYSELYQYITDNRSRISSSEQVLTALRIAQGCGTCFTSAHYATEKLLDLITDKPIN